MLIKIETIEELQNQWRDPYAQWFAAGMPAFYNVDTSPWKQIKIKFKTKEDRDNFAKLYEIELTEKTNVIWYPAKERQQNMTNRYVENDNV